MQILVGLAVFLTTWAGGFSVSAQTPQDTFAPIAETERLINRPGTRVHFGDLIVPEGQRMQGPLAVVRGLAFVSGIVQGDLTVVNGSVSLQREAVIEGDVRVIGGDLYISRHARISGRQICTNVPVIVRGDTPGQLRLKEVRPPKVFWQTGVDGWRFSRVRGHDAAFSTSVKPADGRGFPGISATVYAPTLQNNHGFLDYRVTVEQAFFERRSLKIAVSGYKNTDTPDGWHLPSIRKSIIAYVAREDYYNYHTRSGATVTATQRIDDRVSVGMAYSHDRYFNLPERSPFTIFWHDKGFRVNPVIDEGKLLSFTWSLTVDTRPGETRTERGWYADVQIERALPSFGSDFGFTRFDLTLRRYNEWRGHHLDFRAKIAGSGAPLPLQRAYVLGASGGLRGFGAFEYTGDRLFVANMDYRIPLGRLRQKATVSWQLEGLLFFDIGTAFFSKASGRNSPLHPAVRDRIFPHVPLPLPDGYGDLRSSAGAGLTISNRFIDATLTVGQNLHRTSAKPRVTLFLHRDVF
ncbi:MAG: BamA/TamA family outer membrane protein [candidate division Zixibacteria bacterium]|nr:BamA/TamA family outer membrane protein [candidate division Zixibacteria bacterium]